MSTNSTRALQDEAARLAALAPRIITAASTPAERAAHATAVEAIEAARSAAVVEARAQSEAARAERLAAQAATGDRSGRALGEAGAVEAARMAEYWHEDYSQHVKAHKAVEAQAAREAARLAAGELDASDAPAGAAFKAAYVEIKAARAERKAAPATDNARPVIGAGELFPAVTNPLAAVRREARFGESLAARAEREAVEAREALKWETSALERARSEWSRAIFAQFSERFSDEFKHGIGPRRIDAGLFGATGDAAEFWRAIEARTTGAAGAGFTGWARKRAINAAGEAYGTLTGDRERVNTILDEIMQNAREAAFSRLTEAHEDATATACAGDCGKAECEAEYASPYGAPLVLALSAGPMLGWHTIRPVACKACKACIGKRGAVNCEAGETRDEWLSVGRVIGAALLAAVRNALKRDKQSGVEWWSGEAGAFGYAEIVSAEMREHTMNAPAVQGIDGVAVAEVLRAAEAVEINGGVVIAANGATGVDVGNALAAGRGFALTERGRRSARAAVIEAGAGGKIIRTGAARSLTLSGKARPERRSGLKNDAPVEIFAVTVRPVNRDRRTAPRPL